MTAGTMLEVDPPRLLAFDEDGHFVRYELAPSEGGCTLVITHLFDDAENAQRHAARWH